MVTIARKRGHFPVRSLSARATRGFVVVGGMALACALGRTGKTARKREGDGATPRGVYQIRRVLYRRDRGLPPRTRAPVGIITATSGWCDAPTDRNYNRRVAHPYAASAERLWRDDNVYDIVVVISHNERPRMRGMGSATFIHLAREGYQPTEGCIALAARDMRLLLGWLRKGSAVTIV